MLQRMDIARMNLVCAEGLPGAGQLDITNSVEVIDQMASRVKSETERHAYRFHKNPAEFENSEGFFRMTMMMVVLAEDFRVRYAPNKMATAANASMGDGFFADSQDVFLHGLTGANHQGTCSSLPVLYVAVGRRLSPLSGDTSSGCATFSPSDAEKGIEAERVAAVAARRAPPHLRSSAKSAVKLLSPLPGLSFVYHPPTARAVGYLLPLLRS